MKDSNETNSGLAIATEIQSMEPNEYIEYIEYIEFLNLLTQEKNEQIQDELLLNLIYEAQLLNEIDPVDISKDHSFDTFEDLYNFLNFINNTTTIANNLENLDSISQPQNITTAEEEKIQVKNSQKKPKCTKSEYERERRQNFNEGLEKIISITIDILLSLSKTEFLENLLQDFSKKCPYLFSKSLKEIKDTKGMVEKKILTASDLFTILQKDEILRLIIKPLTKCQKPLFLLKCLIYDKNGISEMYAHLLSKTNNSTETLNRAEKQKNIRINDDTNLNKCVEVINLATKENNINISDPLSHKTKLEKIDYIYNLLVLIKSIINENNSNFTFTTLYETNYNLTAFTLPKDRDENMFSDKIIGKTFAA